MSLSAEAVACGLAAAELLESAGWSAVHERACTLAATLAARLAELGREVAPRHDTTLVSFTSADPEAEREAAGRERLHRAQHPRAALAARLGRRLERRERPRSSARVARRRMSEPRRRPHCRAATARASRTPDRACAGGPRRGVARLGWHHLALAGVLVLSAVRQHAPPQPERLRQHLLLGRRQVDAALAAQLLLRLLRSGRAGDRGQAAVGAVGADGQRQAVRLRTAEPAAARGDSRRARGARCSTAPWRDASAAGQASPARWRWRCSRRSWRSRARPTSTRC